MPAAHAREAWVPVGRRGSKSIFAAALVRVHRATFRDYGPHLTFRRGADGGGMVGG
jgi:hypothetical protein